VQMAYNRKVSILTGGPGTGKSTSLRALLMVLRKRNIDVALAAPTGRAAKRLTEATGGAVGFSAKTLHRLLEYAPHDNSFQRNETNPLPYQFVIVDEMSMVDILLFYHLLKALPPDAHLLLVGDADQLPPVGPGNVLRDLLRSETIPTVRLTELFRQAQQSQIVVNAHRINAGQMPSLQREQKTDFYFVSEDNPVRAQRLVLDFVQNRIPKHYGLNPMTDIQVLTPMYRGPLGVNSLNEELQATNEELETTNDELRARTGELQEMAHLLDSERTRLLEMVELAPFTILVLRGPRLLVEAFTPRFAPSLEVRAVQNRPLDEVFDIFWQDGAPQVRLAHEVYNQNVTRTTARVPSATSKDGASVERQVVYTMVPSHDATGRVSGVLIYAVDETERRVARSRHQVVLAAAPSRHQ